MLVMLKEIHKIKNLDDRTINRTINTEYIKSIKQNYEDETLSEILMSDGELILVFGTVEEITKRLNHLGKIILKE